MGNLEKRLRQGEQIEFESDEDLVEVRFSKTLSGNLQFMLTLNSKLVLMVKTFKSLEARLNQLISERNLIENV